MTCLWLIIFSFWTPYLILPEWFVKYFFFFFYFSSLRLNLTTPFPSVNFFRLIFILPFSVSSNQLNRIQDGVLKQKKHDRKKRRERRWKSYKQVFKNGFFSDYTFLSSFSFPSYFPFFPSLPPPPGWKPSEILLKEFLRKRRFLLPDVFKVSDAQSKKTRNEYIYIFGGP